MDALRESGKLVVSLVAEADGEVVGHVGFSPVTSAAATRGLGLAPLAVRPGVLRRGIGGKLVVEGLAAIARSGAGFVVVLGDPRYYGRFGFGPAAPVGRIPRRRRVPGPGAAAGRAPAGRGAGPIRAGVLARFLKPP